MSFIQDEDRKTASVGDVVTLIAIVGLVVGGYFYYRVSRQSALEGFAQADSLLVAGNYAEALERYTQLQDAGWKSDSLDSILYDRQAKIEGWKELSAEVTVSVDSLLAAGDTAGAVARLGELPSRAFRDEAHARLAETLAPKQ